MSVADRHPARPFDLSSGHGLSSAGTPPGHFTFLISFVAFFASKASGKNCPRHSSISSWLVVPVLDGFYEGNLTPHVALDFGRTYRPCFCSICRQGALGFPKFALTYTIRFLVVYRCRPVLSGQLLRGSLVKELEVLIRGQGKTEALTTLDIFHQVWLTQSSPPIVKIAVETAMLPDVSCLATGG